LAESALPRVLLRIPKGMKIVPVKWTEASALCGTAKLYSRPSALSDRAWNRLPPNSELPVLLLGILLDASELSVAESLVGQRPRVIGNSCVGPLVTDQCLTIVVIRIRRCGHPGVLHECPYYFHVVPAFGQQ
jgi:hypothetical protein